MLRPWDAVPAPHRIDEQLAVGLIIAPSCGQGSPWVREAEARSLTCGDVACVRGCRTQSCERFAEAV